MIRRSTILLASLIFFSMVTVSSALADVYYVTYTGTASGTDTNGVFGVAGATLSKAAFTSTYTYNPSYFGSSYQSSSISQGWEAVYGGTGVGGSSPFLSASITIDGDTYNQDPLYNGQQYLATSPSTPEIQSYAASSASNYLENDGTVSGLVTLSFTASQSVLYLRGASSIFQYNGEDINLSDAQVAITDGPPPAPVPEPTSLALLAGAGGVFAGGLGIRRTKSKRS